VSFYKAAFAPFFCLFFLVFHLIFQILFVRMLRYFGYDVLFYNGLLAIFFSFSLVLGFSTFGKLKYFGRSLLFSCNLNAVSILTVGFVVFPVTFDRSVSTYLLAKIAEQEDLSGIKIEELKTVFVQDYVQDRRAIERRMKEQIISGNVAFSPVNSIVLTDRGRLFLKVGRFVSFLYDLKSNSKTSVELPANGFQMGLPP
jgi:hypothetical protein